MEERGTEQLTIGGIKVSSGQTLRRWNWYSGRLLGQVLSGKVCLACPV